MHIELSGLSAIDLFSLSGYFRCNVRSMVVLMGSHNNLKHMRTGAFMSTAELSRNTNPSIFTLSRCEEGKDYRMNIRIEDKGKIFPD